MGRIKNTGHALHTRFPLESWSKRRLVTVNDINDRIKLSMATNYITDSVRFISNNIANLAKHITGSVSFVSDNIANYSE